MNTPSNSNAGSGCPATPCSRLAEMTKERDEYRHLADEALNTLRVTREKYGIGNRHVMREMSQRIDKLETAIRSILDDIPAATVPIWIEIILRDAISAND